MAKGGDKNDRIQVYVCVCACMCVCVCVWVCVCVCVHVCACVHTHALACADVRTHTAHVCAEYGSMHVTHEERDMKFRFLRAFSFLYVFVSILKCKKPTAPEGFPARSPTTVLAGPSQA